jgi:glycosyltransferase involved in cell wall biosynthesis
MAKYSIVLPSYLKPYKGAAADRANKLLRAINSVIKQTFNDWELIIVADGCDETCQLFTDYVTDERVKLLPIEKQKMFSSEVRNAGIRVAKGEYILYLDSDDIYGIYHLETINNQINGFDWVYFFDLIFSRKMDGFIERKCDAGSIGRCGTSNFCHKRSLGELWAGNGYAREDLLFARNLIRSSKNFKRIETPYYYVCHIPRKYDI